MNKKIIMTVLFLFCFISVSYGVPAAQASSNSLEQLQIEESDIPEGFMYGKIPDFFKDTLKNNPWVLDQKAIVKFTSNIYPNGNPESIKSMYISIITRKEVPYGDDIIYYVLEYKNTTYAKTEIAKLNQYVSYNRDRGLVLSKGNVAVFMVVDDAADFQYLDQLKANIQTKLDTL